LAILVTDPTPGGAMTTKPTTSIATTEIVDPSGEMSGTPWRWEPVSGLLFVALFALGVVASNVPADTASDRDWLRDYTGTRNHVGHLVTAYCLVLAGLSLMTFLVQLWQRIRTARAATTTIVPVVAAGMAGALMAVGGVLMGVVAVSALRGYPEIIRLGSDGGFAMVGVGGMLAAAVSVAWLSVLGLRCGVLGKVLGRSGVVVSVLLLGAIAFIPIVALLVWVAATSVALLRRR
jgi:MFS family permease